MPKETPKEIGERIGRAIADSVKSERLPREWTGLDPQDGDQLLAAGFELGTPEWTEAEAAAEAEYGRVIANHRTSPT